MKHILGFLNTHPLWKKKQFGLLQFAMPSIDVASFTPKKIPTNLRLGHQVEYIFKQLLDHSDHYKVLEHNIAVRKDSTTTGELDFIIRDNRLSKNGLRKPLLHLELTYKFYILDPTISEPIHRLMGPNRRDMFFTKMEKTRDKQLPLIYTPEGRAALTTLNVEADSLEQQTYFVGQLFVPYKTKNPSIRPLNTDCIVGYWLNFDQFNSKVFKDFLFYVPQKYEWLHEPHLDTTWQNHYTTLMDINMRHINERTPMVWIRKKGDVLEKCFVVWW